MLSIFFIFIVELVAFRWGTSKLAALGLTHGAFRICRMLKISPYSNADPHGHGLGAHAAHGPERGASPTRSDNDLKINDDVEAAREDSDFNAAAQIIGVFILEFGVLLHRYGLS
jgi:zinc transporter 1/2/3